MKTKDMGFPAYKRVKVSHSRAGKLKEQTVKRAITCNWQEAISLQMIGENPSTQWRNETELDQSRRLRTGLLRVLDTLRNCCVITFRNRPREDSNFEISHTFDMYCKNKTTTSLTAIDAYHGIYLLDSKSPNLEFAKR